MTEFTSLLQLDRGEAARTIHLVDKASFAEWLKARPPVDRKLLEAHRFDGTTTHAFVLLPKGEDFEVVTSLADAGPLSPWCLAKLGEALPAGTYRLADNLQPGLATLGWLLGQHRLDRYKSKSAEPRDGRVLLTPEVAHIDEWVRLASATALVRDLVDTPASDLGPAELEAETRKWVAECGAVVSVTTGAELESDFPMVAAVGRAAVPSRAPRMIEAEWGNPAHPRVAIVGKGVVFDSGGLDLKPASGMRLMKKDMGGAAHALALARLISGARLPIRLHLLIPAVENAVSGDAFRPGDVLTSRAGIRVEIDNTDAEGRLILADALTRAGEERPELIIDFATLTGAARVALGPDLPATFVNDDRLADDLLTASRDVRDPLWRLPLWDPYDDMLKSDLADISNSSDSPFAGSITAALFLRRFVPEGTPWAHLDTFAWQPTAKAGRPKGGEALGLRAVFATLASRYPSS